MVIIGVIEDQWQDLLKVGANFLVYASEGAEIAVRLYLVSDSEIPDEDDTAYLEGQVQDYHPHIKFPAIAVVPPLHPAEPERVGLLLRRLANDGVNVIVSDSQLGSDEVAGLTLLHRALTDEGFEDRDWGCHLMTKQFESASQWIYSRENSLVDSRIRFLDKTHLLGSFPEQCSASVAELVEREVGARRAAMRMSGKDRFGCFVGGSKSLNEGATSPYAIARIAAETDSAVLIRGESGAGKEVMARAIHQESSRRNGPFVAVDCGALSVSTIESELFGHVKGAFTGAVNASPGKIVAAHGGTLFLDEITNMAAETQIKFLRLLQERELIPLGGNKPVQVDFRLICATNANIEDLILRQRFRPDLFARINTWPIHLPPLRERLEDIPALARDLVPRLTAKVARNRRFLIDDRCMKILLESPWPDNVRGLEHCLERAMGFALQTTASADVSIMPEHVCLALPRAAPGMAQPHRESPGLPLRDPDPSMTATDIWSGIRDHTLRRHSLKDLRKILGKEKLADVLFCAENSIVSTKGLNEFFPGSTQENKRAIKSRARRQQA